MSLLKKIVHVPILLIASTSVLADTDWLLFSEKALGASTRLTAIADESKMYKLSHDNHWRDFQLDLSQTGDVIFSSNRKVNFKVDLQKRSDNYNLNLFKADENKINYVTQSVEHDFNPKFDHHAQRIAFLRIHKKKEESLELLNIKSSEQTSLIQTGNVFHYDWHPSSALLVASLVNNKKTKLVIFDVTKKDIKQHDIILPDNEQQMYYVDQLSWSPDGQYLAYIQHPLTTGKMRSLWIYNISKKTHTQLSNVDVQVQNSLDWSNDSKHILYSGLINYRYSYDEAKRDRSYQGKMPIYLTDLNGTTQTILSDSALHLHPTFSPDDGRIAYLFSEKLGDSLYYELRTIDTKGEKMKVLHRNVSRDSNLIWRKIKKTTLEAYKLKPA